MTLQSRTGTAFDGVIDRISAVRKQILDLKAGGDRNGASALVAEAQRTWGPEVGKALTAELNKPLQSQASTLLGETDRLSQSTSAHNRRETGDIVERSDAIGGQRDKWARAAEARRQLAESWNTDETHRRANLGVDIQGRQLDLYGDRSGIDTRATLDRARGLAEISRPLVELGMGQDRYIVDAGTGLMDRAMQAHSGNIKQYLDAARDLNRDTPLDYVSSVLPMITAFFA